MAPDPKRARQDFTLDEKVWQLDHKSKHAKINAVDLGMALWDVGYFVEK